MKLSIVLGCGFGDEGKGNVVNWLTDNGNNSLVIRFNGGHQAGHTVIRNEKRHVFSSIGAGTLNGTPTFWSKYCTIYPPGFNLEYDALRQLGTIPIMYVDPMCPITTPFDIHFGRADELRNGHGSCGTGFGKTIWRHETLEHSYRIFAKDILYEWILREKLKSMENLFDWSIDIDKFVEECKLWRERISIVSETHITSQEWRNMVFEGAQGILLDREHGISPHVTRSHTTSKNALEIINRSEYLRKKSIDIYYTSRCYQTRHGSGPLKGECPVNELGLEGIENETNVENAWQGKFRYAPFNWSMYNYALDSDAAYHDRLNISRNYVITCLDQFAENIPILRDEGNIFVQDKHEFMYKFPRGTIFSFSPDMSKIQVR